MFDAHQQNLDVREVGDVTVVSFRDLRILDELTIQAVAEELHCLVEKARPKKMLLNLEHVEYMSSGALGKLINLHKMLITIGSRLSFCNVTPQIQEVFAITKLDKVLRTEPYPCDDDPDETLGGVPAPLKPPKPSDGGCVALQPPTSDEDE